MSRLVGGVLHDVGWSQPQLAMDRASIRKLQVMAGAPLTVDEALDAAKKQRENLSPFEKLIPAYRRLR